jgi:hypothetical protein
VTDFHAFDHTPIVHLPEYRAASTALSNLANAITQRTSWTPSPTIAAEMASVLSAVDLCLQCRAADPSSDLGYLPHFPYAVTVDDQGRFLRGQYRCSEGHTWVTGYAA